MAKLLVVIFLAIALVGCGTSANEVAAVTLPEAEAVLSNAVALAQAHDLTGLGVLADDQSITLRTWQSTDEWTTLPADPPTIVDSYVQKAGGGRVLVLEGTDGLGNPYHSELMVFRSDSRLIVANVLYWDNYRVSECQ